MVSEGVVEYCGGLVAGVAQCLSGHPFDTVKVRMQTDRSKRYSGAVDCARQTIRTEGVRGLYRGLVPPMIGGALETGVNYLVYKRTMAALGYNGVGAAVHEAGAKGSGGGGVPKVGGGGVGALGGGLPPIAGHFFAGAVAGMALSPILCPTELITTQLQLPAHMRHFSRPSECLAHIVRTDGLRGVFRGMGGTLAREVPGNGIFFGVYELLRQTILPRPEAFGSKSIHTDLWGVLRESTSAIMCGGLSGMVFWAAIFPLDLAKTRVQTVAAGHADAQLGMMWHLRAVYGAGGVRGLYSGLGPCLTRAFGANACQWLAWELFMWQSQAYLAEEVA